MRIPLLGQKEQYWPRSSIHYVLFSWLVFLVGTLIYCFSYSVLFDHGTLSSRFNSALLCVAKDWLIWVCLTPALWLKIRSIGDWSPSFPTFLPLILFLLTLVLVAACTRLTFELTFGSESLLKTLLIYLPRYLAIALLMAGVLVYVTQHTQLNDSPCYTRTFSVSKGQEKLVLDTQDILMVKSDGNYLEFHTDKNVYLSRQTLTQFLACVDPSHFIRVHRSYVVSQSAIRSVNFTKNEVNIVNGDHAKLGRHYQSNLASFR